MWVKTDFRNVCRAKTTPISDDSENRRRFSTPCVFDFKAADKHKMCDQDLDKRQVGLYVMR